MLWSNHGAHFPYKPRWLLPFVVYAMHISSAGADCAGRVDELKAETFKQTITSPNYPNVYGKYLICRWSMTSDRSYEVIRFQIVDLAITDSANCADDNLEIKDGVDSWSPVIRRYCGNDLKDDTPLTSSSRTISVTFKTDGQRSDRGFKLDFWSVPKDEIMYMKPVWTISNYIALGVFFAIVLFIGISMVIIAILRQIHASKVKVKKKEPSPSLAERRRQQQLHEAAMMARDLSCDSVTTECNTTRTSIGGSTTNLAGLL